MIKGITFGVFDIFHMGHLNMLERAKERCDYLIVGVHDDKLNIKGAKFLYSLEDRIKFVSSIKFVDEVFVYERVDISIGVKDFNVFIRGPDQAHQYFQKAFEYCTLNNREIITLERTDNISSSMFRSVLLTKDI